MSTLASARAASAYGQAAPTGADAGMIVMLYDGIARHVRAARAAVLAGAIEERWRCVGKAAAIVEGLQDCLDHTRGGAVARSLDAWYTQLGLQLQRINLRNDVAACDAVLAQLATMRASWAAVAGQAPVAAPPPPVERPAARIA
ncbi:MAG: flagellar export chaperone FliS [Geminicoccaceae bacterium]